MAGDTSGQSVAQLASLGIEAMDALQAFLAVAQTSAQDLEDSRRSYQELLVEHLALRQELDNLKNERCVKEGGHISDPYVIVLIDAHSHKFCDDLLKANTNGGSKTVKLLKDAVKQHFAKIMPNVGACRIVARVYANLKRLDVNYQRSGSLAGFAAGFSREDSFFDFVDVGDEQIVKSKILDMFEISIKDSQCRHVFLAACHDPKYMTALQIHSLFQDKVSYIKGSVSDIGIQKMHINNVVFSRVFHTDDQEEAVAYAPNGIPIKILETGVCWEFQKGGCFRKDCKYKHVVAWATASDIATSSTEGQATKHMSSSPSHLPRWSAKGMIPVNVNNQRLDLYMNPPREDQWIQYQTRIKTKKVCNAFHLRGSCSNTFCEFDHSPIDGSVRKCLEFIVRGLPCKGKGACRRLDCDRGHVCQKPTCKDGKTKGCSMSREMHSVDYRLDKWVWPKVYDKTNANDEGELSVDDERHEDTMRSACDKDVLLIDL